MSSHHIVRDKQEPALLIADAENIDLELIGSLLEWSPKVIVIDTALEKALSWGIKLDLVISLKENFEETKEKLIDQMPVQVLSYHQDELALNVALYYLLANKYKAVNIVLSKDEGFFKDNINEIPYSAMDIAIYMAKLKGTAPKGNIFEKWVLSGDEFLIDPLREGCVITTKGFLEDEEDTSLTLEKCQKFIKENDGLMSINKIKGNFILWEKY